MLVKAIKTIYTNQKIYISMFKFFGSKTDSDIDHIMEISKGQFVEFERFKLVSYK